MTETDEFGRDAAVRSMRRAFAHMEKLQQKVIEAASLAPLDPRLRTWREQTLRVFEQAWTRAARRGLAKTEEEVALLYAFCMAQVLERGRVKLSPAVLPRHDAMEEIVKELLR